MNLKQRFFALLLICVLITHTFAGIRCFTCINAPSNEACNMNGSIESCAENAQSCQNEVRISSEGFGYLMTKRCKQPLACKNNYNQNQKPAWDPTQCNLLFEKNSICRCCCMEDLCNKKEFPCNDIARCPSRGDIDNGMVTCTNNNFVGTSCVYGCNNSYELNGQQIIECNDTGNDIAWTGESPVCKPTICKGSMQAPENGRMTCTDSVTVGSKCYFECSLGYELVGLAVAECQPNGQWAAQAPLCERIRCKKRQAALSHGSIICSSHDYYESVCQFTCLDGYFIIGPATATCQLDETWSEQNPICERVSCNPAPTDPQNGKISCNDENFYQSACRYSCDAGYFLKGDEVRTCLGDFNWSAQEAICEQITCNPRPRVPTNGAILCSDDNVYASVCTVTCNEGYYLDGSSTTTCQEDFKWSDEASDCKIIVCTETHNFVANGNVQCTEGNEYGSTCKFTCSDGFFVVGSESLTCQRDFDWSDTAPTCQAYTCAPELSPPNNGEVSCSDENKSFSQCVYTCGDGSADWETKGETVTTCVKNPFSNGFAWRIFEPPCCAKRCPPFAQIDLFIILDSSSSVGRENWGKTLNFVAGITDDFSVSKEDLLIALIRYNAVVDTKSEIKIGQYTTKKSTTDAILNMPYDGQGTNTGNALQYAVDSMLTHSGNRPNVQDMVLLVTDGISRDDVKAPALKLRATGTNVVALGISNQSGSLKEEDILDITNDADKTVLLTTGFDGLTPELVTIFIRQICQSPCDRQSQYGSFAANFLN